MEYLIFSNCIEHGGCCFLAVPESKACVCDRGRDRGRMAKASPVPRSALARSRLTGVGPDTLPTERLVLSLQWKPDLIF